MLTSARPRSSNRSLAHIGGTDGPRQLSDGAVVLDKWRAAVQQALATRHLVSVASELSGLGWRIQDIAALGAPVDLLGCFPDWRRGSRVPFEPRVTGLRLARSGAAVPLGTLRLQMSPASRTIPYGLLLLRSLLRTLDSSTRFIVVVEPGANLDELARLAVRFHPSAATRVRFVRLRCVSVFAQDNARAARDSSGRAVLMIPRAFRAGGTRAEDGLDPVEAEKAFEMPAVRSRLHWEGGNVVHDGDRCFVGADTIAENTARLGLTHEEVVSLLEGEFGMPVVALGRLDQSRFDPADETNSVSGQASFHIDLDVSLLGRFGRARAPRALVADAARGLDFVGDVLGMRRLVEGHFLPPRAIRRHLRAEYEASAEARHPLLLEYASTLAQHGYRVTGMPDLRIDPKMDVYQRVNLDFGFCNVLPGAHAGRPAVHHFVSGVRSLDADATRRLRSTGVEPVRVATQDVASALMLLQGGLHCCCGPM